MRSVNQVVIPEYSKELVLQSIRNAELGLRQKEEGERATALDFYYHINVDQHIDKWFSNSTLEQVPSFPQKIVPRMARARNLIYKKPPKRMIAGEVNHDYNELSYSLDSKAREATELTWLLRDLAFRSKWNKKRGRLEYECIPRYKLYFLEGASEPFGISYEVSRDKHMNRIFVFWSEDIDGQPGMHFKYTQGGKLLHINDNDINPYGLMPFTFSHVNQGAEDVIRAAIQLGIASTEIALAERFSFGQPVLSGYTGDSKLKLGIDRILMLDEGSSFSFAGNPGSLKDMIEVAKHFADQAAINNHLRIRWSDSGGNPPSGEALKILELENLETRQSDLPLWREWERERYRIDRKIIEVHTGKSFSEEYSVDFEEVSFPKSAQEVRESWKWKFENNLATREDYFRWENPDISDEDLEKKLGEIDESKVKEQPKTGLEGIFAS